MNNEQSVGRWRRWRRRLLYLGLVAGVVLVVAVGWAKATEYTAKAYLRVSVAEPSLVFPEAGGPALKDFDIYKNTQAQLLKNRFVLTAALRRPEVRELKITERHKDPVGWLADQIKVDFPGKAELMEVSLRSSDPQEAAALVNAVVNAYLTEVVNAERNRRRQRLDDLERVYAEKEGEVRTRRSELKNLAETLGTSDTKALSLTQRIALEQFGELQRQHLRTRFDLRQAEGQLKALRATLKAAGNLEISETDLDNAVRSDPLSSQVLFPMLAQVKQKHLEAQLRGPKPGEDAEYAARLQSIEQDITRQLQERREELRHKVQRGVQQGKAAKAKAEAERLQSQIAVTAEMEQDLAREVEQKRAVAERLNRSSVDLEMARTHLEELNKILAGIMQERERLRVEVRAAPRVILIQPAEVPPSKD